MQGCHIVIHFVHSLTLSHQGLFKYTKGRKLPADFARVGGGKAKKGRTVPEGYVRADSLDKKKLQKYIKGVATEAEATEASQKSLKSRSKVSQKSLKSLSKVSQ